MTITAEKAKRGPGRPKGYPRSGGRQKGTPNRDRAATIEKIMREADPLLYLCKIARGDRLEAGDGSHAKKKTWWFPTGDQRISALQTLARKVLPDMKAVEISGEQVQITAIERTIVDSKNPGDEVEKPAADNSTANGKTPPTPAPAESPFTASWATNVLTSKFTFDLDPEPLYDTLLSILKLVTSPSVTPPATVKPSSRGFQSILLKTFVSIFRSDGTNFRSCTSSDNFPICLTFK